MKNLLLFLLAVLGGSTLLAAAYFGWNYRQHYGDWAEETDISAILQLYDIDTFPAEAAPRLAPPELPNITPYTVRAVQDKIPEIKPGYVLVQNLEDGYRKLRGQLAFFGDLQERLDPLSIVIEEGAYDLESLVKEVADDTLIEKREDDVYVLYVPLSVRADASLIINEGQTLLLSINRGGLLSSFGDIFIFKATVKAWDTENDQPAAFENLETFRPYITAWCGSNIHMAGSKLAHLGYQASKSYGISYTSCTDTLYRQDYAHLPGGTGWLIDNVFEDIYFGFYSYEADNVVIIGNLYQDNIVYAIDPHDRSKNLIIAHNTTRGSKEKHGIIVSREVSQSYIFKNLVEENEGSGIMIDRNSHDNVIAYNISQRNKQDGMTFYESPNNISYQNTLIYNNKNGMRIRNSWGIVSQDDIINFNNSSGIELYSLYLTPERGATYRDLELDPYTQKAGITFITPEMVGNRISNFKLEKFDEFRLLSPKLYQVPSTIFSGDVKGIDFRVKDNLTNYDSGLSIISRKENDQNLKRSSVEPR